MRILRGRPGTGRKVAVGTVAAASALALTAMTVSPAAADEVNPEEDAEAFAQLINTDLITADLLDVSSAYRSSPIDEGEEADNQALNLEALRTLGVELPNIGLPLVAPEGGAGLLHIGNAGALNSYAHAPSYNSATAGTGAVGENGAINLDPDNPAASGNASVDLTSLFDQLELDGVTDGIIDELSLDLGAIASTAESDGTTTSPEYVVADGKLTVSSNLVGALGTDLKNIVEGSGGTLDDAVGSGGAIDTIVKSVGSIANINIPGVASVDLSNGTVAVDGTDKALEEAASTLLEEPLTDGDRIISVDLQSGDITIDLAKVVKGADAEDLNGLDPNTQVLTSETIDKIVKALGSALGTVTEKATDTVEDALNNVKLNVEIPAKVSALFGTVTANVTVTVDGTLGQFAGTTDGDPVIDVDGSLLGIISLDRLLDPLTKALVPALLEPIKAAVGPILTATTDELTTALDGITDPLLEGLRPVLNALNQVVDLTVNEQSPNPTPTQSKVGAQSSLASSEVDGDNGPGFTVNAVSLDVMSRDVVLAPARNDTVPIQEVSVQTARH